MKFYKTPIEGAFIVRGKTVSDERGRFTRVFSAEEFAMQGLDQRVSQSGVSHNPSQYTLQGLHYQRQPHRETKLVRCVRGRMFDVAVDLRPGSASYCRWYGVELSAEKPEMLHIPEGCAHGFLTLESDTEIHYQITIPYSPEHAAGIRWNDPTYSIEWPETPLMISQEDRNYQDFEP